MNDLVMQESDLSYVLWQQINTVRSHFDCCVTVVYCRHDSVPKLISPFLDVELLATVVICMRDIAQADLIAFHPGKVITVKLRSFITLSPNRAEYA